MATVRGLPNMVAVGKARRGKRRRKRNPQKVDHTRRAERAARLAEQTAHLI